MALGGLGIIMFNRHPTLSSFNMALRKVDLQSLFFASMFIIILVVLAYLTNPSETSFRTYLTEQSFRQHLKRLDDDNHDDRADREDTGVHYTLSRRPPTGISSKPGRSHESNSPFHFVNRASVSLRTPKHVFHSFGILTVAAIVPNGSKSPDGTAGSLVSDSWFIGAFGRWWRGGTIQSWLLQTMANTKDAERCNSGILDVKTLDSLEGYEGLPYNLLTPPSHPSKVRDTARSGQRIPNGTVRSITPPPLPKSASLPLHAPRVSSSNPTKGDKTSGQRHIAPVSPPTPVITNPPQLQPSLPSQFDQSPVICEILRQISLSKSAVYGLRTQLTDFRSTAAETHNSIQNDLNSHRERKRTEDASRTELKTKAKMLDDSKRSAEAAKRVAEKKLRAAESARDSASERIDRLDREIGALRGRIGEDEQAMEKSKAEGDKAEVELVEELTKKKKEIKVAEDVVTALNSRAKELEEKIAAEEERLKLAKEQAELRKQDRAFFPLHVVGMTDESSTSVAGPWFPVPASQAPTQDPHMFIHTDRSEHIQVFPNSLQVPYTRSRQGSGSGSSGSRDASEFSISPRPRKLSLGVISNFHEHSRPNASDHPPQGQLMVHPNGLSSFDDNISAGQPRHTTRFSPFGDSDSVEVPIGLGDIGAPSPKSSSLIPMSLIQSLESASSGADDLSRSFQSESDDFLERDWRKLHPFPAHPVESPAAFSSSPISLTHPGFDGIDKEDPFEIRPPPPLRHRLTSDLVDAQRASVFGNPIRSSSDPEQLTRSRTRESDDDKSVSGHRRWFSSSPRELKEKKGLNPEAKVFQLKTSFPFPMFNHRNAGSTRHTSPFGDDPAATATHHQYQHQSTHSLNQSLTVPNMLPHPPSSSSSTVDMDSSSIFSTLSMRAFAPSPAEREVLTRALGPSTNASLERLPTLSEVSIPSIPSSPSHVHAIAAAQRSPANSIAGGEVMGSSRSSGLPHGLAWLQSLPRMRKSKFSPWEDEGTAGMVRGGSGSLSF